MFYSKFSSIVPCCVIEVTIEEFIRIQAVVNPFRYLHISINCPSNLLCTRMMSFRSFCGSLSLWFMISVIIFVALGCTFYILSMSCLKCDCVFEMKHNRFLQWKDHVFVFVLEVEGTVPYHKVYFTSLLGRMSYFDVNGRYHSHCNSEYSHLLSFKKTKRTFSFNVIRTTF